VRALNSTLSILIKRKAKAIPVQDNGHPQQCEMSRLPHVSKQSVHRLLWRCQPYVLWPPLMPHKGSWYSFLLEALSWSHSHSVAGRIRSTEKSNDLIRNLTIPSSTEPHLENSHFFSNPFLFIYHPIVQCYIVSPKQHCPPPPQTHTHTHIHVHEQKHTTTESPINVLWKLSYNCNVYLKRNS
jgi:hypothetical protein